MNAHATTPTEVTLGVDPFEVIPVAEFPIASADLRALRGDRRHQGPFYLVIAPAFVGEPEERIVGPFSDIETAEEWAEDDLLARTNHEFQIETGLIEPTAAEVASARAAYGLD